MEKSIKLIGIWLVVLAGLLACGRDLQGQPAKTECISYKGEVSRIAFLEFDDGVLTIPRKYYKLQTYRTDSLFEHGDNTRCWYNDNWFESINTVSNTHEYTFVSAFGHTDNLGESAYGTNYGWAAEINTSDWYGAEHAAGDALIGMSYDAYLAHAVKTRYTTWHKYPEDYGNPIGDVVATRILSDEYKWPEVIAAAVTAAMPYGRNAFAYTKLTGGTEAGQYQLSTMAAEAQSFDLKVRYENSVTNKNYIVCMDIYYEQLVEATDGTNVGVTPNRWHKEHKIPLTGNGSTLTWTTNCPAPVIAMPTNSFRISILNARIVEAGCIGCEKTAGAGECKCKCVDLSFHLGGGLGQAYVGSLQANTDVPSSLMYSPESLNFFGWTNQVQVIRDTNGVIAAVQAPTVYVQVAVTNQFQYELKFYEFNGTNYLTNQAPYVVWRIEDPDFGRISSARIQVSEIRGAHTITNLFEWIPNLEDWFLTQGGLVKSGVFTFDNVFSTNTYNPTEWAITHLVMPPKSPTYSMQASQTFRSFDWGVGVVREYLGAPDGLNVATYEYNNVGDLVGVDRGTGEWERLSYDASGRVSIVYRSRGNSTPQTNTCFATEYRYAPVGDGDNGSIFTNSPRTVIEWIGSAGTLTELSRRYMVYGTNETRLIVCQTPEASASDTNNLVTVIKYSSEEGFAGRVASVLHGDGVLERHEYEVDEDGNLKTTSYVGAPGLGLNSTNVVDGIKTEVITGGNEEVLSVLTKDIVSDITLGSEVYSQFDNLRRAGRVTYLDGTFRTFQYACCNLEAETDSYGVTTSYTYDAVKRRTSVTRSGVSLIYQYDAASRVSAILRQGTDSSLMLLQTNRYNNAGELLTTKNGLGEQVAIARATNSYGGLVTSVYYPDGTTRLETRFRDGLLWTVTGTGVRGMRLDYDSDTANGPRQAYVKRDYLSASGAPAGEWTKTYFSGGRPSKVTYPDEAFEELFYNQRGQLARTKDADGVSRMWVYNNKGQAEYAALDVNQNGLVDFDAYDRVAQTKSYVTNAHGVDVVRSERWIWETAGVTTPTLVSTLDRSVSTREAWQFGFGLTNYTVEVCLTNGTCYVTNVAPDRSYTVTLTQAGLLSAVTYHDTNGVQLAQASYGYDPHRRLVTVTDSRTGTVTNTLDVLGRITSITAPSPGGGQNAQTTQVAYNKAGQAWRVIEPDGGVVMSEFHPTGELKRRWGSRTYPVEYEYDYAGRVKTQQTWREFASGSGAAVTTWNYTWARGFLESKRYADGTGPDFEYTAGGRLAKRTWARAVTTDYQYDDGGDLVGIDYSDSTPDVVYTYDRLGRTKTVALGGTLDAVTQHYTAEGLWAGEQHTAGLLAGVATTNTYDGLLRRAGLTVKTNGGTAYGADYTYDQASRLGTVNAGLASAAYGYMTNAPGMVRSLTQGHNGTTRQVMEKGYDLLDRLTGLSTTTGGFTNTFSYQYNDANQRVKVTREGGSYWNYGYDELGQLTEAKRHWADHTGVRGQEYGYGFDDLGNRERTTRNGGRTGRYEVNGVNEYGYRTVAGMVDVLGTVHTNATVTVNGQGAVKQGEYFHGELGFSNLTQVVYGSVTNLAVLRDGANPDVVLTNVGKVFLPASPERYGQDADGNLLQDGRWSYTWDAENRLVEMETITAASSAGVPRQKLEFVYDAGGRRLQKTVSLWNGSTYTGQYTNRFVYDGWNLIMEFRVGSGLRLERSYVWGLDVSESLQGAGGVGGLLALNTYTNGTLNGTHLVSYDGNGNVEALLEASTGLESARYEYGPFGEPIRVTGALANLNPFRFSTKYEDLETGLLYYGYRYYSASTGRWLSRDPIGELGGLNLYGFVGNDGVNYADYLGLAVTAEWGGDGKWLAPGPYGYLNGNSRGERAIASSYNLLPHLFNTVDGMLRSFDYCVDKVAETSGQVAGGTVRNTIGDEQIAHFFEDGTRRGVYFLGILEGRPPTSLAAGTRVAVIAETGISAGARAVVAESRAVGTIPSRGGMIMQKVQQQQAQARPTPLPKTQPIASNQAKCATDAAKGSGELAGQLHHAISTKVGRAVDNHPILKGLFEKRDPRFVTRASDGAAHRGYQRWHRDLDDEVVDWVERNPSKGGDEFLDYLRQLYQRPDLVKRFPNGF